MKAENCGIIMRKGNTKHITIRISEDVSQWMRKKGFSPTAIFNEAIKELGYKRNDIKLSSP
ncbi:hypothetical protein LCGC14_1763110 [marine sediment metagenome]|uniref:Ribbon-helix-helix protein CopG domain-containing protein n=1 Tax=marine sediment metagenome TaxID=412755 RepID=A0A0F9H0E2_9ZZZZ